MGTALLSLETTRSLGAKPARVLRYQGVQLTIHADSADTGGQFGLIEGEGGPGGEPPMHVHQNEDELFYVLEGTIKVFRGAYEMVLQPGQSAFLPRNLPHTFKIMSKQARMLVYVTPGGFEGYFRELGVPAETWDSSQPGPYAQVEDMMRVAGRYGIEFVL